MELFTDVARQYVSFAEYAEDSPCLRDWALGVAADPATCALLGDLPRREQQPNLVFAAARWHGAPTPSSYADFAAWLRDHWVQVRPTLATRATQTNEAGRIATLLPALAEVAGGQPLSLLEVGGAGGLCLLPDRWAYRYRFAEGRTVEIGEIATGPVLECTVTGEPPLPAAPTAVAWRAGLDLNPLDVTDDDTLAWLETLVWPEQEERRARLRSAAGLVRELDAGGEGLLLVRGDLLTDLEPLLDRAPAGTVPVVFHSAVLAYLDAEARDRFDTTMRGLVADGRCHWVSNEGLNVLPSITATAGETPESASFVLGIAGRAVAFTHQHGAWLHWL